MRADRRRAVYAVEAEAAILAPDLAATGTTIGTTPATSELGENPVTVTDSDERYIGSRLLAALDDFYIRAKRINSAGVAVEETKRLMEIAYAVDAAAVRSMEEARGVIDGHREEVSRLVSSVQRAIEEKSVLEGEQLFLLAAGVFPDASVPAARGVQELDMEAFTAA